jgi:hypothetical protein
MDPAIEGRWHKVLQPTPVAPKIHATSSRDIHRLYAPSAPAAGRLGLLAGCRELRGNRGEGDRAKMQIDDQMVNLSPGVVVTVEIKTGSCIILSYLLSPLFRYRQETFRER